MLRPYQSCQNVKKNLHAWETGLSPLQFQVMQELGAEYFSQNEFWDHKRFAGSQYGELMKLFP